MKQLIIVIVVLVGFCWAQVTPSLANNPTNDFNLYWLDENYSIAAPHGLFKFTWGRPCWLVSTSSFTALLTAKANVEAKDKEIAAARKAIIALTNQTNMDAKYNSFLEKRNDRLEKKLKWADIHTGWKIAGTIVLSVGSTILVYEGVSRHLGRIGNE